MFLINRLFSQLSEHIPSSESNVEAVKQYLESLEDERIDWLNVEFVLDAIDRLMSHGSVAKTK